MLLAERTWQVVVVDDFDPFHHPAVKPRNIAAHGADDRLEVLACDITAPGLLDLLRARQPFDVIIHLAAKAGVRGSIADPMGYHRTNVLGTQALLDVARELGVPTFVYASSSSVYGVNTSVPWQENAGLEPISPYACSKAAGELLVHGYSHLYGIRSVVLRLFTVYGPRQRPDLAIHHFARRILDGRPIQILGDGKTVREQAGDVPLTYSSIDKGRRLLGYQPIVSLDEGLERFVEWFRVTESSPLPLVSR